MDSILRHSYNSVPYMYVPVCTYMLNLALKSDSYSVCFQPARRLDIEVTDFRWGTVFKMDTIQNCFT